MRKNCRICSKNKSKELLVILRLILFLLFLVSMPLYAVSNKVVLVTGGAGYIGSHTCKALKEDGFIPVTYDSLALGEKESVKWGPLVVGDLLDLDTLDRAFTAYKPCAVLHFAALRNVGESVKDPAGYYTNNIIGSINLFNMMIKHKVEHLIFSSSCTVYGNCEVNPISEENFQAPTNPYAISKHVVERIIKDYSDVYNLKHMILRYFNAAGIEVGLKRSVHSCNFLIPRAMLTLLHSDTPMKVFGSDYPTPDGTAIRDYIHVKDLALAHVMALRNLQERNMNYELNLGTGRGYSVLEILQAIEKISGKKVPYEMKLRRKGDVAEAVAEVCKAKKILGFEAKHSDLQTILKSEWVSLLDNIE